MHYCVLFCFLLYTQKHISVFAALCSEDTIIISSQRLTLKKKKKKLFWTTEKQSKKIYILWALMNLQVYKNLPVFSIIKWKIRFLYTALPWIKAMAVTTIEISHNNQTKFFCEVTKEKKKKLTASSTDRKSPAYKYNCWCYTFRAMLIIISRGSSFEVKDFYLMKSRIQESFNSLIVETLSILNLGPRFLAKRHRTGAERLAM